MTTATPSSLLATVRPEAAAITAGCALPIAYDVPAQVSISTSFGMSPKATTSSEIPRSAQHSSSARPGDAGAADLQQGAGAGAGDGGAGRRRRDGPR